MTFTIKGKRYRWNTAKLAENLRPLGYIAGTIFAAAGIYLSMLIVAAFAA